MLNEQDEKTKTANTATADNNFFMIDIIWFTLHFKRIKIDATQEEIVESAKGRMSEDVDWWNILPWIVEGWNNGIMEVGWH